ncbi:TspO/MBR family protein [Paucihalobacter sp.]|uniref:TspO/MBR family protein n=1 Tax=Paucihalobacter sp. TaxID=2850405 RepID=UPI002FE343D8
MKFGYLLVLFLILNFGGLAIGSWLMGEGPSSNWYMNLNKASWTPPGWVFGAAWTLIMFCFSIYLTYFFKTEVSNFKIGLFVVLWLLNVSWNYFFFNQQQVLFALFVIITLTLLILFLTLFYVQQFKAKQLLLLPYAIWLLIASSLNAYVYFYN